MKNSICEEDLLYKELQDLKQKYECIEKKNKELRDFVMDLYVRQSHLLSIIACMGFLNRNINEKSLLFGMYYDKFRNIIQEYGLQGNPERSVPEKINYKKLSLDLLHEFRSLRCKRINIKDIQNKHHVSYGTAYKIIKNVYNSCQTAFYWGQERKKGKWSKISLVLKDVFAIPL